MDGIGFGKSRSAERPERVLLYYLEQYISDFTFTNIMLPTMHVHLKSNQYGIVFKIAPRTFRVNHVPDENWIIDLEKAAMRPFHYYWILDDQLLIVFDAANFAAVITPFITMVSGLFVV